MNITSWPYRSAIDASDFRPAWTHGHLDGDGYPFRAAGGPRAAQPDRGHRSVSAGLFAGDYLRHPDYGPFTFEYHPFCPSDSLEITAYTGPKTDPGAIAADLLRTIESFGYVRHVRMAVLVDKTELCAALCAAGFAVTAYLPGWHLQNGVRYDCVLVTRCLTPEEPVDHGTRDLIDYFNQGYIACSPSTSV